MRALLARLGWSRHRTAAPVMRRMGAGFTLIELLVVMAIVATLVAIAAPRYFGSVEKSKEVALRQSLLTVRDAIDKLHADTGGFPESLEALVTAKYLRAVPVDPFTERNDSWQLVMSTDDKAKGVADIKSGAQGQARDGTTFSDW